MKNTTIPAVLLCAACGAVSPAHAQSDAKTDLETVVRAVEQTTGWTAGELKAGLDRLDVLYRNDMQTADGRRRWHGKVVQTEIRTNDLQKVQRHEDGYVHIEAFKRVTVPPVRAQLTEAERKAKVEAARQKRITDLETQFEERVQDLMRQKQWPEPLARLYLQNELAKLKGSVTVDAVITPQN